MKDFFIIIACFTLVAVFVTGIWWVFYALWNLIAAGIFGLPELTYWEAVGLLMLVGMFTNGVRYVSRKE